MPKVHTPLPQELVEEFTKAASILDHFIKGKTQLDQTLIPPKVIANAKGVAVMTIVKAGFVWSGRAGAGLVVAKLPDGRWSAPSAIAAGGAGVGAQIGAEVTDTVFILNTESAVKAFSIGGNVTFGANLSIAAGPTGRQAEASGAVGHLAPIYSYSKTKGLFAGISFEGLVIVTRKETNARFYGTHVTPAELLSGKVEPPAPAEVLYRALNHRGFGSKDVEAVTMGNSPQPSPNPVGSTNYAPLQQQSSYVPSVQQPPPPSLQPPPINNLKRPMATSASTGGPGKPVPPPPPKPIHGAATVAYNAFATPAIPPHPYSIPNSSVPAHSKTTIPPRPKTVAADSNTTMKREAPPLPPKLVYKKTVTALYDFTGERVGDLSFRAGDGIIVIEEKEHGWWVGEVLGESGAGSGLKGNFPANYGERMKIED